MTAMVDRTCAHLAEQLSKRKFRDGVVFCNNSKPHEPGTVFTPWDDAYKNCIADLHSHFVVTTADKLSSNYVVVCAKQFVTAILQDLNSGVFNSRVHSTHPIHVVDKVATDIAQAARELARFMYTNLSTDDLVAHMKTLPYAAALVKLHKSPIQFRFLACSARNGLKPVAMWLTPLFAAIHVDLNGVWHALLCRLQVDWKHLPPWSATR